MDFLRRLLGEGTVRTDAQPEVAPSGRFGRERADLGGQSTGVSSPGSIRGLVTLEGPIVAGPKGFLYATTTCPYCGDTLDPLPTRRRACPHCGEKIIYAVTPDGIRFLHREGHDLGLAAEAAEERGAWEEYGAQQPVRPRALQDVRRREMQRAAQLGLYVRITAGDEDPRTCGPCKALEGRVYPAAEAPILPYKDHSGSYVCNCRSALVLP